MPLLSLKLQLQRARVRRAQKAFRERKENHVNGLESKISTLEKIIEEMSNTFLGFSNDLLKSRRVNPAQIWQTTGVFLTLSQRASRALDEEPEETGKEAEYDMRKGRSSLFELGLKAELGFKSEPVTSMEELADPLFYTLYGNAEGSPLAVLSGTSTAQDFRIPDPHRNYLWGMPQGSSMDGTSAIPYILAGRDSFASRLYFESIALIVRALRGEASKDFLESAYRYKRHYVTFDHILGVTSGVLNMLLHGTSKDPKGQSKSVATFAPEDETAITVAIARDMALQGSSKMEYLNTWNVERYLRDRWGLGVDSTTIRAPLRALEAYSDEFMYAAGEFAAPSVFPDSLGNLTPFAPTMVPGFAHAEQVLFDAQSLVEKIVMGAVSLGEGPRWHVSFVDGAVESFLQENRTRYRYN
jgi:hypothetical protein